MKELEISGRVLARNTLLNFIGQVVPLAVAIIALPFIVRGLGTERFGLLSLAWVILGYFTIFDLGLGRATTKFVAEALGKGDEEQIPRLVRTTGTIQAILGIVGALFLAGITPLLVERILNIPPALLAEAKAMFYLLALTIPVVLVSSSFSGVLEARQRFDLVNAVRIPLSISTYLLLMLGLILGFQLPGIVVLILVARLGALATFVIMNLRVTLQLRRYSSSFILFSRLFSFGGWVTATNIVSPILVYFDRFLIGSLLSMAAVAYYSAPYEAVTKLSIVSESLTMTLFPAFSTLEGIKDRQKLDILFARSIKYVLLILGPIIVVIGLFAKEILLIWIGADFAIKSTGALHILAFGVLVNSLARIPFALLQGVGRPDLPAKFHLLELPIYIGVAWILVSRLGIAGAAGAWTLRVTLDAVLLFGAVFKVYRFSPRLLIINGTALASFALLVLIGIAYGLKGLAGPLPLFNQSVLFMVLFGLFAWLVWRKVLDASDRGAVFKVVNLWRRV